jgi:hypothetical protein
MSFFDFTEVRDRTLTLTAVFASEDVSSKFITGMLNRMGMSRFKYGAVKDTKGKIDHVASMKERLARYEEDGNAEWLMDVANMCMIEYMVGNHPKHHFRATDSDESPGRVGKRGQKSSAHNDSRIW